VTTSDNELQLGAMSNNLAACIYKLLCLRLGSHLLIAAAMDRPRGGFRQRMRAAAAARDALLVPVDLAVADMPLRSGGHLADTLLQLHAWGLISAPTVQIIAAAAVLDGLRDASVGVMAQAGTAGRHPQNVPRDISRHFGGEVDIPPLYNMTVRALSRRGEEMEVEVPLLLPHQLLSHIVQRNPRFLVEYQMSGELEAFWRSCIDSGDPALHEHPMLGTQNWKTRALPLLIYGDGAAFTRNDSLEIVSCSALGQRGATWRTRLVLAAFVKSAQIRGPGGTWDRIWEARETKQQTQSKPVATNIYTFVVCVCTRGVGLVSALPVQRLASCNGSPRGVLASGLVGTSTCR
jgi:hypothetical protein